MTTRFVEPLYEPKRRVDREDDLKNEIAFKDKVISGLDASVRQQDQLIASLQGELAELRANSLVLMGMRK